MASLAITQPRRRHTSSLFVVHSHVFASRHYLQILNLVIQRIMVFVVNNLGISKWTPKMLGHYQAMFVNIALIIRHRMLGAIDKDISLVGEHSTTLPLVRSLTAFINLMSAKQWHGIAKKMALRSNGVLRQISLFTASALAKAGRYFIRFWHVGAELLRRWFNPRVVTCQESGLVIRSSSVGGRDYISASAFANFHSLSLTQQRR